MADIDPLLHYIQPGWKGVEIGVNRGASALALFEHGVRFLWLVDPWAPYHEDTNSDWDVIYKEAMDRLSPYAGKHAHLRMPSEEAAQYIPEPVDFVWIDGDHRYAYVKRDLELYWPKIRSGGKLCGHDYTDNADTCQVKRAVDEFYASHGAACMLQLFPDISSCWMIFKP